MILNLEIITEQRENRMTDLWRDFQTILTDYSEQTNEKYSEYVLLRERDNEDTKQIREHYIDIAVATNTIADLRNSYETNQIEHKIRMDQLLKYEKLLQRKYQHLKLNMENGLKLDKEQMRLLVVCGTDTIKVRCFSLAWNSIWFKVHVKIDSNSRKSKNVVKIYFKLPPFALNWRRNVKKYSLLDEKLMICWKMMKMI